MRRALPKLSNVFKDLKSARSYSVKARHLKQKALQNKKQAIKDNKAK